VVTIGTFDGVHIGHRAIPERLVKTASESQMESLLLTFFPHPRMVLQKDSSLKLINTLDEKKELLEQIGLDHLVIHPFTMDFSRLTALEYVRDILVEGLGARRVVIGYDHRFGRNRTATIQDLRHYGKTFGFEVEELSARQLDDVAVSSTKIRNALMVGDVQTANNYLGYSFMLTGTIVKGRAIGRTIDYPTANLAIKESYKLIPASGVYVVSAEISGKVVYGITSIGNNPTVGGTSRTIETYFLDFEGDLYGKHLRIDFLTRIRGEKVFGDTLKLKEAIARDEAFAREYLGRHG
jgi:riboflavin kinase/FMN adenylyltransferase